MVANTVLIEAYDFSDKIYVIPFDDVGNMVFGSVLEVLSRKDAFENYTVVGEISNGEIVLFNNEDELYPNDELNFEEDDA